ncbi:methyltransferase domain-containing protein [Arthrobacter crusticola]|uniref:Methyltransferase domain-containing protein n=1 Tax=Arthrobacter crusticola TaxID=2547960 RepID=A0A4R5U0A8_9MICC|nr:methyltransferase [Arthrobacter crusticola]TDK26985.1 methyltransferase domain-containing protein [Arthrobacter crusticola]
MESQHYFSSQPAGPGVRRPLSVVLDGEQRDLVTSSGLFSPDGIDKGTAILLGSVPEPRGTRLLDVGSGWGPLALTLALKAPAAQVYAVDVNERCIALTRDNAARLGLANVSAGTPDDVDPSLEFDTIWSNPPIRIGKAELHALLLRWLPRLAPGGEAWLVVQKNLGADSLQRWLTASLPPGFTVRRADSAKSFRILHITRPAD